jgi:c-di-GMP-binding flagellar brake protein YcgR
LEERRAARRYKLALQIEIRLDSDLREFERIFGRTRDISTHGFYFRSAEALSVGMKIRFSIMPPWEGGTHAFISGRARVARVEEVSESSVDHVGVGAVIEAYKFGQTESPGLRENKDPKHVVKEHAE